MGKSKVTQDYTVEADQQAWLEAMARKHDLPDASKALRIVLDHAIHEGNDDDIYGTVRCHHC